MRKYNISANLVRTIEQLYDKATSAVQMNGSIGEKLGTVTSFRYLGAVFQMMVPNQRFSQGLHKPLQLLQS